jgi:environmental stress-induced protein Ves
MATEIIRASRLSESRWLNGAGRKADIASGPSWMIGYAWLDQDAPFSDYAGHDRTITLLQGFGFTLSLPEGSVMTVKELYVPAAFDGAGPIACHLLGGPCMVLNANTAYPLYSHTVQVIDSADLADVVPGSKVFVVVLRGSLTNGADVLEERDTLRLASATALHASPDGRVAVIRIDPMR